MITLSFTFTLLLYFYSCHTLLYIYILFLIFAILIFFIFISSHLKHISFIHFTKIRNKESPVLFISFHLSSLTLLILWPLWGDVNTILQSPVLHSSFHALKNHIYSHQCRAPLKTSAACPQSTVFYLFTRPKVQQKRRGEMTAVTECGTPDVESFWWSQNINR